MKKILVIMGSSRSDGETAKSVGAFVQGAQADIVDLLPLNIAGYDYEYRNEGDDFESVSRRMVGADIIVFATPVYWYAMSGPLKIFFDRFSDLVRVRKTAGRALAGKDVYLLANGTDDTLPDGFEVPFRKTCEYLDMNYRGAYYFHTGKNDILREQTWRNVASFHDTVFGKDCSRSCAKG